MNSMLEARSKCWSPDLPILISGGKAVGVAGWEEAKAASIYGFKNGLRTMGTIGGTGLAVVVARSLQDGNDRHLRRAFESFPHQEMAERVFDRWYIPGGREGKRPDYKAIPMVNFHPRRDIAELTILANYATVWLAKEGHQCDVAINYLMKVETPHLLEIFGAMLAGIDVVVVGAGFPRYIRQVMDRFARYQEAFFPLDVEGGEPGDFVMSLNPASFVPENKISEMKNPRFFPVVSRHELAKYLANKRRSPGGIDGCIVTKSGVNAGHSAQNRSGERDPETGEPIWDEEKDYADLEEIVKLGIPFYPAGGINSPEDVKEALAAGATGVQVGSITAASEESRFTEVIKYWLRKLGYNDELRVRTNTRLSPTGFYFNTTTPIPNTVDRKTYLDRERICDIGYLRRLYKKLDGTLGYRCPADDVETYTASFNDPGKTLEENLEEKKAREEDTINRECLCNELCAGCGLGQKRRRKEGKRVLWEEELARVTFSHDTEGMNKFFHAVMRDENDTFTVADAFDHLLGVQVRKGAD